MKTYTWILLLGLLFYQGDVVKAENIDNQKALVLSAAAVLTLGAAGYWYSMPTQLPTFEKAPTKIKHIIFDLDGVLLTTNTVKSLQTLGIENVLYYFWNTGKTPNKQDLLQLLTQAPAISTENMFHNNQPVPQIMVDWQTGRQSNEQILTSTLQYLDIQKEKGDVTLAQHCILKNLCKLMFTPHILASTRMMIPQALDFITMVAQYAQEHGIKLYICSNWDPASIELIKQDFKELFSFFPQEHIFISGKIGALKPHPAIFEHIIKTHHLNPDECLFIDDEATNVISAQALGINTIHMSTNKYIDLITQMNAIL
ncbi:hypothetical protein EBR77_02255 [bacterium]|nr:hypothetical protein [bacterium]